MVAEGGGSVDGGSAKWGRGRGRLLVRRGRKGALAWFLKMVTFPKM